MITCKRCRTAYPILSMMAPFTYWMCYARDTFGRRCLTMNVRG